MICFKESISRSLDHRPVTAYHLSLFFSFSSSSFFLFFFFFLLFPFFLFLSNRRKKKIIFFFLSCSCSGPKPRWSGEQWQTCRRQPGTSAFCLYLSKGFCFCSSILFSLTVLKVKEWLPFPPDPTRLQPDSNVFSPHFFFSWITRLWIFGSSVLQAMETKGAQYSWWYVILLVFHTLTQCSFLLEFLFCIFLGALWHHTANPTGGFWWVS